ncbi:MAG: pseudouridine-5'-phosphate glycosidase [Bacilli bacterium]|jgi:pseudouridine-5'-phosphate glycosidase
MIKIADHIAEAMRKHQPIVALESTIISHGMPYPQNVKTALEVEQVIRDNGAIPATIGIIDGIPIIGMTPEEIEAFGKRDGIEKVSRRDLPEVIANGKWGATTVAATMILAAKAGIEFFVTGGIGGVHRGASETFDISADLQELAQTNVTVICAGAKAILDLKLTLEYLETMGVPVYGYQTDKLPAFYTKDSPYEVDKRVDTPEDLAQIVYIKRTFPLDGGILVTNPIPDEYSLDANLIEATIVAALKKAKEASIEGKDTTPFLLKEVVAMTKGRSLEANIALVKNNAQLGAKIAKAYRAVIKTRTLK